MQQTPHARGFSTSLGFLYGVDHWVRNRHRQKCRQSDLQMIVQCHGLSDRWVYVQTQQSFEKVCKYGNGGNSTDLWYTDRPAWGMNGTYGDYIYVGHAVETIMQHNASAAPLFYYLACATSCPP